MSEKPKPFCGHENVEVRETFLVGFTVRCWNDTCLASGPYKGTPEKAVKEWNAVPREIKVVTP